MLPAPISTNVALPGALTGTGAPQRPGRRPSPLLLGTMLTACLWPAPSFGASQTPSTTEPDSEASLTEQLRELDQKVRILERRAELAAEAEAEKAKSGAGVTAGAKDGFSLRSNDGAFTLRLRGYVQLDGRHYAEDPLDRNADSFLLRRVRPIFEGTLYKRFAFRIMPDFGGSGTTLQDAYLDWKLSDAATLRVGKFKAPFGLERLQSATDLAFVERALPTGLAPNRDLGLQLAGSLAGGKWEYAVGAFNGVADGASADSDTNDGKDFVARVFAAPWRGTPGPLAGLSFGFAVSHGDQQGSPSSPGLAGYRTAGQQTFFAWRADATAAGTTIADGSRRRYSPQATFYRGPFGLLLEAVRSEHEVRRGDSVATLDHQAWQIAGTWVLTGENASWRWHAPKQPFASVVAGGAGPSGQDGQSAPARRGWGALALVARYNAFAADPASFPTFAATSAVEKADGWAVGLDWTLERQIRVLLDYEVTSFDGGAGTRPDERVLFTRFQIGF
jgi:phosphate-selective porin OprO/OprP